MCRPRSPTSRSAATRHPAARRMKPAADPLLLPVANNGGPTDTMALAGASPAIDAGDPAACPPLDQRGVARLGVCDIGAFEYYPPPKGPPPTPDTKKPKLKLGKLN